jgi:hypothetical protein
MTNWFRIYLSSNENILYDVSAVHMCLNVLYLQITDWYIVGSEIRKIILVDTITKE